MGTLAAIPDLGPATWISLLAIAILMVGGLVLTMVSDFDRAVRWHLLTVRCHEMRREQKLKVIAAERDAAEREAEADARREARRRNRQGFARAAKEARDEPEVAGAIEAPAPAAAAPIAEAA